MKTTEEYIASLPQERREIMQKLLQTLRDNLPTGFKEGISYGMITFSVPLSIYPKGYHCTPGEPLPFISMASQKGHIALYHLGIYMNPPLLEWFKAEYPRHTIARLDMGKSCIRFKKPDQIPFSLIAELAKKMSAEEFVGVYEGAIARVKK